MSENLTTNVELDATANGTVSFATDVVATIAGLATTEGEGVAAMINNGNMGLVDMLRKNQGNRPLTRGVKVDINGNQVTVHINVTVDYGSPVPKVAREIQDNVKKAIETMTGLEVPEINIYVQGISFEKENRAAAELEQKQRAAITAQKLERLGKGEEPKAEDAQETGERAEEPAGADKRRRHGGFALKRRDEGETGPAPEQEPAAPEAVVIDEPEPAQESAETGAAADSEPVACDEPDAAQPDAAEADEAAEEPVCDGHCDSCTLECDAAERDSRTDGAADGEADAQPEAEGENEVE
ncbi:MAG: Asp23/Gls24 family envelope stress response protein [Candidatus Fimadaptatus sp.]